SNWAIQILPYIEQGNLFQQYDDTQVNSAAANQFVVKSFVSIYSCPSDINQKQVLIPDTDQPAGAKGTSFYMSGSYRAMSGVSADGANGFGGYPSEAITSLTTKSTNKGIFHTDLYGSAAGGTTDSPLNPEKF